MKDSLFQPLRGSLEAYLFNERRLVRPTLFYRIEIPLKPFVFAGKTQRTSVRMEWIQFPVHSWRAFPTHEYRFPVNPNEGYIDGSIYLGDAHNPADATRISFGNLNANVLTASFDIRFDFTFEGGASELGVFSVSWPVELACDPSSLDAVTEEADRTGARR